jgi:hypothetical protein
MPSSSASCLADTALPLSPLPSLLSSLLLLSSPLVLSNRVRVPVAGARGAAGVDGVIGTCSRFRAPTACRIMRPAAAWSSRADGPDAPLLASFTRAV